MRAPEDVVLTWFSSPSGTILGTMIRTAKEAGVTPWSVLPQAQRFWSRGYDGNGTGVTKLGPEEARMGVTMRIQWA